MLHNIKYIALLLNELSLLPCYGKSAETGKNLLLLSARALLGKGFFQNYIPEVPFLRYLDIQASKMSKIAVLAF